ncbi:MAG: T9SS type A sorting domain-containing protein [Bacteroidota bacterium]|nr:T9SS type A sorting domain-containing protein [Bacteroidota bacterium]MDP3145673.1 T9SS type A sorting domain-containing protein [Bacteroidota bacterium]MDP3558653.1 T9SS type A sorting domain-containing protein [Bacteroidota bacterium]
MAQPPNWQWAKSATGANAENGNCITTDVSGNVFVAGYFYSPTIIFGTYTLTNTGNYDLFIVKYDINGNVLWAKSGGGAFDDVGLSIAADGNGNVYVTGYFYSPVFTLGTFTLTNNGVGDAFIAKFDGSGNEIWLKNYGGANEDNGNGICINNSGDIFVTGFFRSSTIVFGTYTLTNTGADDIYIAKLDLSGNTIWAKSAVGSGVDVGNSVAADNNGNVFITGFFSSPSIALDTYSLTNLGGSDIFVAKYDALGNTLWAERVGGIYNDKGYSVAADLNGNVILTGTFFSPSVTLSTFTITNNGDFDFFVAKYNGSGNVVWAKGEGSSSDDTGYGVVTDLIGDIYVTGHFHSPSITLGTYTLSNAGIGDLYVLKYDANGNAIWAQSAGGTSDDGSSGIAVDASGNVFVTGYYISSSISFSATTLLNTGTEDMFVAKLGSSLITLENENAVVKNNLLLYPNPSAGLFYLKAKNFEIEKIEIFNQMGLKVYDSNFDKKNEISVDISAQPSGFYSLKINTNHGFLTSKIILR